jgi:hypothetical protein
MRHYEYESSLFVKTFVNWGGGRYHRQYNLLTYINTVFRLIACFFSVYFQQVNKTSPVGSNWYGWISKSPTWSEILLSSLSMIFIGCLLSHFDRSWSFIMEAILWRMWRHVITWPLSSLKCIGQRSRRLQKVIINKMGVLGGYFQLRQCL